VAPVIILKLPVAPASGSLVTRIDDLAPMWQPNAWQKPHRTAVIGLGDDRARRRERVVTELPGAALEIRARLIDLQRRERITAAPRRLEDVAPVDLLALQIAGLSGDADFVLGAIVIGFEIGVAQRPVDERGIFRNRRGAVALNGVRAHPEIVLVKSPGNGAVVNGAAAGLVSVVENLKRRRACIAIRAPGDGLALGIRWK
jgi:hypothetical protein